MAGLALGLGLGLRTQPTGVGVPVGTMLRTRNGMTQYAASPVRSGAFAVRRSA